MFTIRNRRWQSARALASHVWEEAQAHFERALAAEGVSSEGTRPASDAETAALLFGLGARPVVHPRRTRVAACPGSPGDPSTPWKQ